MKIALVRGYGAFGKHRKAKSRRKLTPANNRMKTAAKACKAGKWKRSGSRSYAACVGKHLKRK